MDLSEIVAVTGMPGLFKVTTRRADGLIVTSLLDDKTQFIPGRTHLFTTLDNITIYTTEDTSPLKEVLASIKKNEAATPVPDGKKDDELKKWMEKVLPNYDKEKVHVSDMKKLAKWYNTLNGKNLIEELTAEKKAEDETKKEEGAVEKKEVSAKKESKPKKTQSNISTKANTRPAAGAKKITTPRKAGS